MRYEQNTKELLFSALYRLLQFKGIESISVDEILRSARVSRSTFYRNFRDKFELLQWSHERLLVTTFAMLPADLAWREVCLETLRMFRSHPSFYRNGIKSDDVNSLPAAMRNLNREYYNQLLVRHGFDPEDPTCRYALDVYLQGSGELVLSWIRGGMREDPEVLTEAFSQSFPRAFVACI